MKNKMKKIVSLVLVLAISFTISIPAFAAEKENNKIFEYGTGEKVLIDSKTFHIDDNNNIVEDDELIQTKSLADSVITFNFYYHGKDSYNKSHYSVAVTGALSWWATSTFVGHEVTVEPDSQSPLKFCSGHKSYSSSPAFSEVLTWASKMDDPDDEKVDVQCSIDMLANDGINTGTMNASLEKPIHNY